MERIKGYIQITRPLNLFMAFVSIFIGGFVSGTIQPIMNLLLACFSGVLITAGANTINDYYDLEIDRINRPNRPLPAGLLCSKEAHVYSWILFSAGVVLSFFIHLGAFFIAIGAVIILYFYSARLKRTILLGNITVSFFLGIAFIYGGLAVGRIAAALIVGVFSFLYNLGREIMKDIEDIEGDRSQAVITFPIRYGIKKAFYLIMVIFILLIVFTIGTYCFQIFSLPYLIIVAIGVDGFLIYVMFSMWRFPDFRNLRRLSNFMKVSMLLGLLAVYVGR
jgi:geranylgeranylglycerol-phosphate geranylgeranyltransferase